MWFLGCDLDDEIPNQSVLSKARVRWGVKAFTNFFERIVWQCVEAGLVYGKQLFVDASLIDTDASNNCVVDTKGLKKHLNKCYRRLENRLDDFEVQKTTPGTLRYKTHHAVVTEHEVITSTKVTPGSTDDGDLLEEIIERHEHNTQSKVDTVVADSKYGKIDNFLLCYN